MTKGTRFFLIGAVVVVTAGLATGLVAFYNGSLTFGSASQPEEFSYLPSTSTAVAYADVRAIMNSEFRKRLRQVIPTGDEQEKLRAEIGVDIEKDIDTVVAAMAGTEPGKGGVVLIRGRFTDATIEAAALRHGARTETYKGKKLLLMEDRHGEMGGIRDGGKPATGCLAFLERGLLALGDSASVKRAIDTGAGGESVTQNAELMKLITEIRSTGNAWAVGRLDALSHNDLPGAVRDQLSAVQFMGASVKVNGGVSGLVRAEARDDQSAEQLRDVVRGALAAGKLMSGKDARIDAMLNSFQLQGTGKTVALTFTVPPEVFDILNGVAALRGLK
jgi:hypothetical protein